ncbi:MAG: DUF11 domain-containing protein [Solirubrobacterales bacterium]|nr:DUF11 domain-containing protein [Solirubrobacterales bacterium]
MRGGRGITRAGTTAAAAALLLSGCGGGERQDANEESGTYTVDIVRTDFPSAQTLAQESSFVMTVRNAGAETIPNLAVTLDGFARRSDQPGLSDPGRPLWIVDQPPQGAGTAYNDTWTTGSLAPGARTTLRWRVTPVVAGSHTLEYAVAAGLDGKARAVLEGGRRPAGKVRVRVSEEPAQARVDPESGEVVREEPGERPGS